MPRPSSIGFSPFSYDGSPPRLTPPAELGPRERKVFIEIAGSVKAGHFQAQDTPLLTRYAEASVLAAEAAIHIRNEGAVVTDARGNQRPNPWVAVHGASIKSMIGLSGRLRLSPQGRAGNVPSRGPSYYDRMDLERDDVDAG
jgi:phage terminase small subunit